jgi:hypothetical protein
VAPAPPLHALYFRQAAAAKGFEQCRCRALALAAQHAIKRFTMFQQFGRNKRGAMATSEDQGVLQQGAGALGKFEHLRHVSQVIQREAERLRPPAFD